MNSFERGGVNAIGKFALTAPNCDALLHATVHRMPDAGNPPKNAVWVEIELGKEAAKSVRFPKVQLSDPANVTVEFAPVDIPAGDGQLVFSETFASVSDDVEVHFENPVQTSH